MAQITEYTNQVEGLRPTETGIDALDRAGRTAHRTFDQVGNAAEQVGQQFARNVGSTIKTVGGVAEDYLAHKDTSQYNAAASALTAAKAKEWNRAVSGVKNEDGSWAVKPLDPDDPSAVQTFMEGIDKDLGNLKDNMFTQRGQDHAESHNTAIRNHFQTMTMAEVSSLAADAAKRKSVATVNNYSNAAVQDPAGVENYAKLAVNAIETEYSNHEGLRGAAGVKAREDYKAAALKQIYQSAAMSAISKSGNPEATAQTFIQKYPDYIDGKEAITLAKSATTYSKMNRAYDLQIAAEQRRKQVEDGKQYTGEQIARFIKPDGMVDPTAKAQVLKDLKATLDPTSPQYRPGVAPHAEALFKFATSEGNVVESDPIAKSDLQRRLFDRSNPLDPGDIIKATNDKKLSHADAGIIEGQRKLIEEHPINTPAMRAVFDGAKASLVVPTNHSDFVQDFIARYLKAKADGSLKTGDLNFSDPNSLVSKTIADHQPDNATKMQYKVMQAIGQGIGNLDDQSKILNAPTVPASMTTKEAIEKYGAGAIVKVNGNIVKLPAK